MKVVQVIDKLPDERPGRLARTVMRTAEGLVDAGVRTELFCPAVESVPGNSEIGGVSVVKFDYFYPYACIGATKRASLETAGGETFSMALAKRLRTDPDIDAIHVHCCRQPAGAARTASVRRHIPYVVSLHQNHAAGAAKQAEVVFPDGSMPLNVGRLFSGRSGGLRVLKDAAAVICVNPDEAAEASEILPHSRIEIIPDPIDDFWFEQRPEVSARNALGISTDSPVILVAGRIEPGMNQMAALRTIRDLKASIPEVRLIIAGPVAHDGYFEQIRKEIETLSMETTVTLRGFDENESESAMSLFYQVADVQFVPSVHDPFAETVPMAWAAGLPVVASAVAGIRSIIKDGVNGLLFDPFKHSDAFDRLADVLSRPALASKIATSGNQTAALEYSRSAVSRRLADLYADLTA